MLQYIIVAIVIGIAVCYAVIRIHRTLTRKGCNCDGCSGCAMASCLHRKQKD